MEVETATLDGRPEEALREYLTTHSQVAFLVLDGADAASQNLSLRTGNLGVPVVLVAGNRGTKPMPQAVPQTASKTSSHPAHQATPVAALG
jgi:hypothetical protein